MVSFGISVTISDVSSIFPVSSGHVAVFLGKMSISYLSSLIYWTYFVIEFYEFSYSSDIINPLFSVWLPNV